MDFTNAASSLLLSLLAACGVNLVDAPQPVVVAIGSPVEVTDDLAPDCRSFDRAFEPVLSAESLISLPNRQAFIGDERQWEAEWSRRLAEREVAFQQFMRVVDGHALECLKHAFAHRYPVQGDGLAWVLSARVLTRACVSRTELQRSSRERTAAWQGHDYSTDYLESVLNSAIDEAAARRRSPCSPSSTRPGIR